MHATPRELLKHSEIIQLLCKFHSHTHNPWLFKIFKIDYFVTFNVQFWTWYSFTKSSHKYEASSTVINVYVYTSDFVS